MQIYVFLWHEMHTVTPQISMRTDCETNVNKWPMNGSRSTLLPTNIVVTVCSFMSQGWKAHNMIAWVSRPMWKPKHVCNLQCITGHCIPYLVICQRERLLINKAVITRLSTSDIDEARVVCTFHCLRILLTFTQLFMYYIFSPSLLTWLLMNLSHLKQEYFLERNYLFLKDL